LVLPKLIDDLGVVNLAAPDEFGETPNGWLLGSREVRVRVALLWELPFGGREGRAGLPCHMALAEAESFATVYVA
jgi:hypothetical protein